MYLLNPPAYGHPYDDGEERPPFVLMEPHAYFADRHNATTATCRITGFNGTFKVTFCAVRPPLVSYMCFHATDYKHTDFAVDPRVLATETDGGLVLLRVVFCDRLSAMNFPHYGEYLVYDASGPSLEHLPCPTDVLFSDDSVAFVRKGTHDDGASSHNYVLAAHSGGIGYGDSAELYLYHSDTNTWTTKRLVLKPQQFSDPDTYHSTCKAITIGGYGGIVAWVDLWHNIILCNVLAERPKLHCLELPAPIVPVDESSQSDPSCVRDIALLDDDLFRFVEMQFHVAQPGSSSGTSGYWEAKVWSAKRNSSSVKDWHADYEFRSSDIAELPILQVDPGKAQPTLSTLHTDMPNVSLQEDGIVYFLSKVYHCNNDHVAWVLAVDMRNKKIEKVGEFRPTRTVGLADGYSATRISKYLKGTKQNPK
ncbi:uncharacterized protein [Lolium perenne]|uniref:uncharacterized protein isoform X2 n=1 Tax=Lolium perenne TaxID=4522 RepID=UPI0021F546B5|nr:uncharacterized protein LOC127303040 isoform X2 [Lolium perenne]